MPYTYNMTNEQRHAQTFIPTISDIESHCKATSQPFKGMTLLGISYLMCEVYHSNLENEGIDATDPANLEIYDMFCRLGTIWAYHLYRENAGIAEVAIGYEIDEHGHSRGMALATMLFG